jgi:hypothetical protein
MEAVLKAGDEVGAEIVEIYPAINSGFFVTTEVDPV